MLVCLESLYEETAKGVVDSGTTAVRSVITFPADGTRLAAGTRKLDLRGHAWAGDYDIKTVDISTDYGVSWKSAKVDAPPNKFAWQRFTAAVDLPTSGYYEIWAKATDSKSSSSIGMESENSVFANVAAP